MSTDIANPLSCPFCGCPGADLEINQWHMKDGEADAYECPVCLAGAPLDAWNKRVYGYSYPVNNEYKT